MLHAGPDPRREKVTQRRTSLDVKWSSRLAAEAKRIAPAAVELICHVCVDLAAQETTGPMESGSLLRTRHSQGQFPMSLVSQDDTSYRG